MYANVIRILAKRYLPISLVIPLKLKEILKEVKTNPDYDLVLKRLHLYYHMKLVTFRIDKDRKSNNTISSICTIIHTATANTISNGDCTSSGHRSEHTSRFLHVSTSE